MGRTRDIKPVLLANARLYSLEAATGLPIRWAFAALATACDRAGRFRWEPDRLKAQTLPLDPVDYPRLLEALVQAGLVVRYEADGATFGAVLAWPALQTPHFREPASTLPPPPSGPEAQALVVFPEKALEPKGILQAQQLQQLPDRHSLALPQALPSTPSAESAANKREKAPQGLSRGSTTRYRGVPSEGGDPLVPVGEDLFGQPVYAESDRLEVELEWRVQKAWRDHVEQADAFYRHETGRGLPGRGPSLTPEIAKTIRAGLQKYDRDLLTFHQREEWLRWSKVRAAGIGIFADDWNTGRSERNDVRNGGRRYLEHWRPWRRQVGKGCPIERFSALYFENRRIREERDARAGRAAGVELLQLPAGPGDLGARGVALPPLHESGV